MGGSVFCEAFLMEVKPGKIDEYEKSHNPVWPELQEIMKDFIVSDSVDAPKAKEDEMRQVFHMD